jgi:hypothetical protein
MVCGFVPICSQYVYLHNSIYYNRYSTVNIEKVEEGRSIILNKAASLLAALYGRLIEMWVSHIDSSLMVMTDTYTPDEIEA